MNVACVFSIDDKYVIPFKVFFHSLSSTQSIPASISVIIIHSESLSIKSRKDIISYLRNYNRDPLFIEATNLLPRDLPIKPEDHVSEATFYRLFIADVLPSECQKAVYFDVDMIVVRNVSYLFRHEVKNMLAAADMLSPDEGLRLWGPCGGSYFQAGVLVIPVCKWREMHASQIFLDIIRKRKESIRWWDQDVLNIAFKDNWDRLPVWVNVSWTTQRCCTEAAISSFTEIRHWAGLNKPWNSIGQPPFIDLWDKCYNEVFSHKFERAKYLPKAVSFRKRAIAALRSRLMHLVLERR